MKDQEIPEGFKELKIPQPHIENLGPGFYKKEDDQLFMIFFVKKEHSNFYESAHGGALMALADFCMTSSMMKDRNSLVTTVSFHTEFLAPAPIGSMLLIRCRPTMVGLHRISNILPIGAGAKNSVWKLTVVTKLFRSFIIEEVMQKSAKAISAPPCADS